MLYVVLSQNEFGLRDACYVDGEDILDAMNAAREHLLTAGIYPENVTVLPVKENRLAPYMFPSDPATDVELVLDFLRGYIRPVLLDYSMFYDLTEADGFDAERRAERMAADAQICAETASRILTFGSAQEAGQTEE